MASMISPRRSVGRFTLSGWAGRGLAPGHYFRLLMVGGYEGLDSERGIAWRAADSLSVRAFVGLGLTEAAPDHTTISWTRRLIDPETHQAVFTWVLHCLGSPGSSRVRPLVFTRPRSRRMRRYAASCGATRANNHHFLDQLAQASASRADADRLARIHLHRPKKGGTAMDASG